MKVFVFLLMMAVAVGGMLGGYRVVTGRDLVGLSDFGIGDASAKAGALLPTARPTMATTVPTSVALPIRAPAATATPVPAKPQLMVVGNTDGAGVFLRKTPHLDDKLSAWVDGTKMEVTGGAVESDGHQWLNVRAPDGTEGYIPKEYLVPVP